MQCPRCQHVNPAGVKFCGECGARLESLCPACQAANPPANKFCHQCGGPLTGEPSTPKFPSPESYTPKHLADKIITSKAALEGERKLVTVLFADLKGSMELLADRDPEEARKLLDPVLELMMEAVHHYEGTVNQVMGDGIMALFGAPLAHEDHAVRACYAALRMQQSVKRYAEGVRREHGVMVRIRVGLNSGGVVVRAIGSDLHMDYTAVGQTTHLAARMEQLADPGSILLTPDTLASAEGFVQVRSLGPTPVKGLPAPVEVYELTGVSAVRSRVQAAVTRGLSRFVGRDAEMEQLRRALEHARQGRGQVAAIVGEPGVGKSRLVFELTHSHRVDGWLVLEASSVSYGKATSYLPVIDLLKGYFRIGDRDTHRDIREKVTGKILTLDRALEPALPALLALTDVPTEDALWAGLEPSQRRQRTLDALRRLLLRETQIQPVLLVFEDLHWIDSETQALLDSLVESLPTVRGLLLVNYRPEYSHGWGGKTYYTQLRLDTLPAESAGELLDALLGSDPSLQPLKTLLTARTGGNPLFLEESARALVEARVLAGERGAYRLIQPVETVQVPATVQAILASRIDRLPAEQKRLLQTAAVIGKDFSFSLLQAIAEEGDETLRRGLDQLQAAEFVYETSLFPDLEYTFKHALTHEVAYGGLLQERRRTLHARIVEAMERLHAGRLGEHVEQLAHHAVRGELWERAVRYLRQAGAKAATRSAHREAVGCLEQALSVLEHLPPDEETARQAIDLRLDLRNSLWPIAQHHRILEYLRDAERVAERLDDVRRLGMASAYISHALWFNGEYAQAISAAKRAASVAQRRADVRLELIADLYLGQIYYTLGDYRGGANALRRHLEVFRPASHSDQPPRSSVFFLSHTWLAFCLAELGDFAEAAMLAEEELRFADDLDQPEPVIAATAAVGIVAVRQGRLVRAIQVLERCVESYQRWDRPAWAMASGHLSAAYAFTGRLPDALALREEALRQGASLRLLANYSLLMSRVAEVNLLGGRLAEARDHAVRALELARRLDERGNAAWGLHLLAEIDRHDSSSGTGAAEQRYREAMSLAGELGMRPLVAHCHLGLGRLFGPSDRRDEARDHFDTAGRMYREMGMEFWLVQAETEMREIG